jgi:hypothetical protein
MGLLACLGVAAMVLLVAGVVYSVIHLVELLVVAVAAGWLGYRIGLFRGVRQGRRGR